MQKFYPGQVLVVTGVTTAVKVPSGQFNNLVEGTELTVTNRTRDGDQIFKVTTVQPSQQALLNTEVTLFEIRPAVELVVTA